MRRKNSIQERLQQAANSVREQAAHSQLNKAIEETRKVMVAYQISTRNAEKIAHEKHAQTYQVLADLVSLCIAKGIQAPELDIAIAVIAENEIMPVPERD